MPKKPRTGFGWKTVIFYRFSIAIAVVIMVLEVQAYWVQWDLARGPKVWARPRPRGLALFRALGLDVMSGDGA